MVHLTTLWPLLLLPLALLPFWPRQAIVQQHPALYLLPHDALGTWLEQLRRLLATLTMGALLIAFCAPFLQPATIERIGRGAQITVLLDRSVSMSQAFGGRDFVHHADSSRDSKILVARRLLADFATHRTADSMSILLFSNRPIVVLPMTGKQDLIQAAIAASDKGRGLADTNLSAALFSALEGFSQKSYQGSRILLLVSDGGAKLETIERQRIAALFRQQRAALYWLYIRSRNGPKLTNPKTGHSLEYELHNFFGQIGIPYRAYSASEPAAMKAAITEIGHRQQLPIHYREQPPRQDLAPWLYRFALVMAALSLLIEWRWHRLRT